MRQDSGVDGDAQRISQLTWLLFLKVFDALEEELELTRDDYKSPIPEAMRWRNWAADPEGITGDDLLDFVNTELFVTLKNLPAVVVDDNDMGMIHDMALYRQSRVQLEEDRKVAANKAFFNVEAIPEGTVLAFPLALKPIDDNVWDNWKPLEQDKTGDIYLGGLESVGFGHCMMTLKKPSGGAS